VQLSFFKKQAKMQLSNSNIPPSVRNTRYSIKKTQNLLSLVLFAFCSFFVLQRWWRCGDLHPGLERLHKTFYILIRRLIPKRTRPTKGFIRITVSKFRNKAETEALLPYPV